MVRYVKTECEKFCRKWKETNIFRLISHYCIVLYNVARIRERSEIFDKCIPQAKGDFGLGMNYALNL